MVGGTYSSGQSRRQHIGGREKIKRRYGRGVDEDGREVLQERRDGFLWLKVEKGTRE